MSAGSALWVAAGPPREAFLALSACHRSAELGASAENPSEDADRENAQHAESAEAAVFISLGFSSHEFGPPIGPSDLNSASNASFA
jgi:hypothetical protein